MPMLVNVGVNCIRHVYSWHPKISSRGNAHGDASKCVDGARGILNIKGRHCVRLSAQR